MKITADTITDEQIRELLAEYLARSPRFVDDEWTIRDCEIALGANGWRHGVDCRVAHGYDMSKRRECRARSAEILNNRSSK